MLTGPDAADPHAWGQKGCTAGGCKFTADNKLRNVKKRTGVGIYLKLSQYRATSALTLCLCQLLKSLAGTCSRGGCPFLPLPSLRR